ncbi:hypothetical protein N430_05163 [Pseudomonas sp. CC120222-01a]|nr:hypothetical protein N430_05163 [Pseudomonas sp. CC120222-01a]
MLLYNVSVKRYLVALYLLCYSVPFLGLARGMWAEQIVLWPIGNFTFDVNEAIVARLTSVWFLGLVGGAGALLLFNLFKRVGVSSIKLRTIELVDVRYWAWFFFLVSLCYVTARALMPEEVFAVFTGIESFAVCAILVFFSYALLIRRFWHMLASLLLAFGYAYANTRTGDRDFVVLFVAMMLGGLFYWSRYIAFKALLLIGLLAVGVLASGVYVSMVRMDVPMTEENVSQYLLFNSWNAIILPMVDQLTNHWDGDHLKYGKTYFDMVASMAPSPIYTFFGSIKPITLDNPADWYYIFGLGGMHAAGVGFENFGLMGVAFDVFLSLLFLLLLDRRSEERSYMRYLLYMLVSASVMHWLWYGAMYVLNMVMFFGLFAAMVLLTKILLSGVLRVAARPGADSAHHGV